MCCVYRIVFDIRVQILRTGKLNRIFTNETRKVRLVISRSVKVKVCAVVLSARVLRRDSAGSTSAQFEAVAAPNAYNGHPGLLLPALCHPRRPDDQRPKTLTPVAISAITSAPTQIHVRAH
jgi:hypothetical protein